MEVRKIRNFISYLKPSQEATTRLNYVYINKTQEKPIYCVDSCNSKKYALRYSKAFSKDSKKCHSMAFSPVAFAYGSISLHYY